MSTTNPTRETTEWDDLQRKFGNLPPLPKEIKEEEIYLENLEKLEEENILDKKNLNELHDIEEKCIDDEYLKIIEKYKNDRINEINRMKAEDIYGEVFEISKENFLTDINEASKKNPLNNNNDDDDYNNNNNNNYNNNNNNYNYNNYNNYYSSDNYKQSKRKPKGTHVLLHLYSENVISCKVLNNILKELAQKHKYIKFTKGIYNRIIENYPENKLPTILIYYNGTCIHQICNVLDHIKGGLNNLNTPTFEKFINKYHIFRPCHNNMYNSKDNNSDNCDDEDELNKKNIRTQKQYTSFNMFYNKNKRNQHYDNSDNSSVEDKEIHSRGYASSYLDSKLRLNKF
ncbi:phosducin-like protein, putative [Plasmodium reichenowi]|uniref:Phosducin-like protein, putative n=1 Tax=Plasmodium reichenowi TaxID=5854 RepID=A0A151L3D9_PLARE|nr:phosducin-like protein, putative [Plasmodium reichenowi]KYN93465.1 phosducin-like protein, putative [Plasmodium reichenowi]